MKKVLTVCTTPRDRRELSYDQVRGNYNIMHHEFDADLIDRIVSKGTQKLPRHLEPDYIIDEINGILRLDQFDGVIATDDYPGSLFASFIAQQHGFNAASVESLLTFQHKYYSRIAQQKHVPQATPRFTHIDPRFNAREQVADFAFPFFIKPVKSYFSLFADSVAHEGELETILARPKKFFLDHFDWFLKQYPQFQVPSNSMIAEGLLHGVQVTLEGHVFNGQVTIHGVVDSIMFPETICFGRFDYPSLLPVDVQNRMEQLAARLMTGIGFDNGIFNIEFMYNPDQDTISIIEVNPRMASQFADLFEKVDGTNSYSVLLDLATGQKPSYRRRQGKYSCASSYVLRTFQDQYVHRLAKPHEIENIYAQFPDLRLELFGREGFKLSDELQDGKSFRYGYIHLGAADWQELNEKLEACEKGLPLIMEPVH